MEPIASSAISAASEMVLILEVDRNTFLDCSLFFRTGSSDEQLTKNNCSMRAIISRNGVFFMAGDVIKSVRWRKLMIFIVITKFLARLFETDPILFCFFGGEDYVCAVASTELFKFAVWN